MKKTLLAFLILPSISNAQTLDPATRAPATQYLIHEIKGPSGGCGGFTTLAERQAGRFGTPIAIYRASVTGLQTFSPGADPSTLLEPNHDWLYPVYSGDRPICAIRLSSDGKGGWRARYFEGLMAAQSVEAARERFGGPAFLVELRFVHPIFDSFPRYLARRSDGKDPREPASADVMQYMYLRGGEVMGADAAGAQMRKALP